MEASAGRCRGRASRVPRTFWRSDCWGGTALTLVSAAGAIVDAAAVIPRKPRFELGLLAWAAATVMPIGSHWAKSALLRPQTPWRARNPCLGAAPRPFYVAVVKFSQGRMRGLYGARLAGPDAPVLPLTEFTSFAGAAPRFSNRGRGCGFGALHSLDDGSGLTAGPQVIMGMGAAQGKRHPFALMSGHLHLHVGIVAADHQQVVAL